MEYLRSTTPILAPADAWTYFKASVAQSLAAEIGQQLLWAIQGYAAPWCRAIAVAGHDFAQDPGSAPWSQPSTTCSICVRTGRRPAARRSSNE